MGPSEQGEGDQVTSLCPADPTTLLTLAFTDEGREAQGSALGQSGGDEDGAMAPRMLLCSLLSLSGHTAAPNGLLLF